MADLFFSEYIEGSSNNKALEIYNNTDDTVDLAAEDYLVQTYFNGSTTPGLTIDLNGTVANEDVFVLAQSNANSTILAQADQTNGAGWFNGDDAVVLRQGGVNGTIVDAIGQIGNDPGTEWGSGLTSTSDNTLRRKSSVTTGDTNPNDAFDPSVEWDGFATDTFDDLGRYENSGGATPDDGGGTPDEDTTPGTIRIHDIQGAAQSSPLVNQSVTRVPGIVTAVRNNGFYLQDPNPDGNDATSEGIFVFTSSAPTVSLGNSVLVSGTVSEFIPGGANTGNLSTTQITSPTIQQTTNLGSVSPTIIGVNGRTPPTEVIDNDNFSVFDPTEDGIDFYESLEATLVQVNDAVAVSPTNNFGEIYVLADNGANATGRTDRGGIVISPDDFNPERIQIDDTLVSNEPQVNVGDQLGTVTGVLDYNFGNFEVLNTSPLTATAGNLTRETTTLTGNENQLTVASFNVLNLDPGDTEQITAIANQIANNLQSPDILGLQEVQDNNGATNDSVVDASGTLNALIDAIAAAGGPTYEFRQINPVDDQNGGQPGGNIRVGFLFNPDRVDFVDRINPDVDLSTTSTTVEDTNSGADLSLSPGLVQPTDPAFEDSRKPLAGEFIFNGNEVFIVANHFTSKGGSTPLFGQTQPPINGGEEQREDQAQVVNNFVDDLLTADPNANVVVLGDLNEFQFEEPLQVLEGDANGENPVLTNLTETLPADERYSYIFEGNSQALDHILVSDNLLERAEYDPVHVNAEFVEQASDHDPVLSRFTLNVPTGVTNGTPGNDSLAGNNGEDIIYGRGGNDNLAGGNGIDKLFGQSGDDSLTGGNGDDILNGGRGNDTLLGGRGSDRFVFTAGDGTDTIGDFKDGQDLIQLSSLTFEQLTIAQGTGNNSNNTLISLTSNEQPVAILSGVQSSTITAADFVV